MCCRLWLYDQLMTSFLAFSLSVSPSFPFLYLRESYLFAAVLIIIFPSISQLDKDVFAFYLPRPPMGSFAHKAVELIPAPYSPCRLEH